MAHPVRLPDDITALWQKYLDLENCSDRVSLLKALGRFIERMEQVDAELRAAWVNDFLQRKLDDKAGMPIRAPLFQRLLFPELKSRYLAGDARACRWLASLSQELFRYRDGWEALGWPGEVNLWKEAHRRDEKAQGVRTQLVACMARFIEYTLHELPDGVLYGNDGATLAECRDLLRELTEFRELLTPEESDKYRDLLELASFHYMSYAEYLGQTSRKDYSTFLAERGTPRP